jgi:hypothetical protein
VKSGWKDLNSAKRPSARLRLGLMTLYLAIPFGLPHFQDPRLLLQLFDCRPDHLDE